METTVYTCDLCKKSKSQSDLSFIRVSTSRGIMLKAGSTGIDICKDCLKNKGFVVESTGDYKEDGKTAQANSKNLESKLLDILEELGVSFYE